MARAAARRRAAAAPRHASRAPRRRRARRRAANAREHAAIALPRSGGRRRTVGDRVRAASVHLVPVADQDGPGPPRGPLLLHGGNDRAVRHAAHRFLFAIERDEAQQRERLAGGPDHEVDVVTLAVGGDRTRRARTVLPLAAVAVLDRDVEEILAGLARERRVLLVL